MGPRIDPCGTPDVTSSHSEWIPSTTTLCCLPCKYDANQSISLPSIPNSLSLWIKYACDTLSKALAKSKKITSTS